jgi:putative redox protein
MTQQPFAVPVSASATIEGTLSVPPGQPFATVLFAHCLAPESGALSAICRHFLDRGCAVLALDCGLDAAGSMQAALGPEEITAAARALGEHFSGPMLMIGHSWGGVLALACASDLQPVQAVVAIATPAGSNGFSKRATTGANTVSIAGRPLTLPDSAATLAWPQLKAKVERLRRPILILHAPMDNVADIASAAQIFTAAKHPKSFVSLDSADHVLARATEGEHAAAVICGWATRYLKREEAAAEHGTEVIVAESGGGKYRQHVKAGRHRSVADEPESAGGADQGPSPYELLLSALGACTAMTLRMYADLKKLPLAHVAVELRHDKIHAAACEACESTEGKIDRIERVITLKGDLTDEQRQRLLEIANKCPVHRTLHAEVWVPTSLAPQSP